MSILAKTSIAIYCLLLFSSCQSVYFKTPNDLRNMNGTVYLTNGKTVEGRIIVNAKNLFGGKVKVYEEGDRKPMQFSVHDVKGYSVRGSYFALKEIRTSNPLQFGKNHSFLKRLSPEQSLMHLYEGLEESTSKNSDGSTRTKFQTQYYLEFPGEKGDAVWALNSSRFVPNFDEKMSRLLNDCPTLARKIAAKENGYFYAQVTVFKEKRADVLMNIIEDYNSCKSAAGTNE